MLAPFAPLAAFVALLAQDPGRDSLPLYDDLGDHHHEITTSDTLAQRYFDQGLRLVYGFNHPDAIRSFRLAQRRDPACAMCHWGEALALGPNINVLMDSASGARAFAAVRRATELAPRATPKERALIAALATRYAADPLANRKALDSAYARAMRDVARRYPADDDAAVLYAEAEMLLGAWDYWTADKRSKPHGAAALRALAPVVARSPNHAGACHFYIHAVEAAFPERAVACAERLPALMPGAGHVVHMPGHIYIRVGRYADAIARNVHALHADEAHLAEMAPDGVYRLALHPHNAHFLAFAASMIGRSAQAMDAARLARAKTDTVMMRAPGLGGLQHFHMLPVFTMVRFARWDDVLAEPEPAEDLPYPRAVRHYARAMAFVARSDLAAAETELAALRALRDDPRVAPLMLWDLNRMTALLDIAGDAVQGEIAAARGQHRVAIAHLRRGVAREDSLTYDEPPPWHIPVRQQLGAVLLAAGRAAEAEAAFRRDLERHPENGWSLHGLAESLRAQRKPAAARAARARFERAWATADVPMPALHRAAAERGPTLGAVRLTTGIRMRYAEAGRPSAEPVILLHGFTDSWYSWDRVLPSLGERAHLFALDQRGHGGTDRPAGGYSLESMAADVIAFMDAMRLPRATIVGHSMGSMIAQHVATIAPQRVTRLVLVGSTADPRNEVVRSLRAPVDAMADSAPAAFVREFQTSTVHAPVPAAFMERVIADSRAVPPHVWRGALHGMLADGAPAPLGRIAAPTLIVWGEHDAIFGRADQDALVAAIPGALLKAYPATGHAPHWEQPDRFVSDLGDFLTTSR